jgi:hypothetical protein
MATVTPNVRYLSLFTAIRYLRKEAGKPAEGQLPLSDLWRRVEALIAVSTILHHRDGEEPPTGVVGRGYADRAATLETIKLETRLQIPPYSIYRGTLGGLGLFDLSTGSDPLFKRAEELGRSWDLSHAGEIGLLLQDGVLPPELPRSLIAAVSSAFCLCRVPDGSLEQRALITLLFAIGSRVDRPVFEEEERRLNGIRVASWRLLLELVAVSGGRRLVRQHLMGRLLESDLLSLPLIKPLADCLLVWRWVAARSFFERGWTLIFNRTLGLLRGEREGLSSGMLRDAITAFYLARHQDEPVSSIVEEARQHLESSAWLIELFRRGDPRDCLLLIIGSILAAQQDHERTRSGLLETLWRSQAIPLAAQEQRLRGAITGRMSSSQLYADLSEETIVQHVHTALRKMSQGNPDSLHVDFDNGRWIVPPKALDWHPRPAEAFSRLDIALGWSLQLGLAEEDADCYSLTSLGMQVRRQWDEEYKAWE